MPRHVDPARADEVRALIAQRLLLLDQGVDHFQLLGVAPDAPPDDVRMAYFALARQLHPDRLTALGIDDDLRDAQRLFAQVNTAFAILSDRARREEYLQVLRRGGTTALAAEQAQAEAMAQRIIESEEAFLRGEAAMRRDQLALAITELARAVELNPDEADYRAALAWAQFCAAPTSRSSARRPAPRSSRRSPVAERGQRPVPPRPRRAHARPRRGRAAPLPGRAAPIARPPRGRERGPADRAAARRAAAAAADRASLVVVGRPVGRVRRVGRQLGAPVADRLGQLDRRAARQRDRRVLLPRTPRAL